MTLQIKASRLDSFSCNICDRITRPVGHLEADQTVVVVVVAFATHSRCDFARTSLPKLEAHRFAAKEASFAR